MKQGADALLDARKKQFGYGTYRLLVVTDGETDDAGLVDGYTPDIISRGITIDAIGVEMQSQHTLATMVHSYRSADDPGHSGRPSTRFSPRCPPRTPGQPVRMRLR